MLRRTTLIQGPAGPPGTVRGPVTGWTPGAIASGSFVKTTVSVTGALVGFPCLAPAWSVALPDGVFTWAQVVSNGTVAVYMMNLSGATQTIVAGSFYVEVLNQ